MTLLVLGLSVPAWTREKEDAISLNNRGVSAMNAGKFREAIRLLQQASELKSSDTILQNLAMAMNNLAVKYLSDTEPDRAIDWLMRAMQIHPVETIGKNMAHAFIMKGRRESGEGRHALAQQLFRDAIAADPFSSQAHEWLGRSFYEEGRLTEALEAVEKAYRLEKREELKTFADKIRKEREGEKNFFEQRGMHFRIFYSPDINPQNVSKAAWTLERAYQEHRMFLGDAPKSEIPAVFYSSKDKFTGTHDLTSNVAGIYDGKVRMPIPDNPDWEGIERTLSHELAHAFLFDVGGADIPVWVNEGLAELLATGTDRPTPALDQVVKKGEKRLAVWDLSATLKNLKNNTQATLAYDEAYSIAKFIHGRFGIFGVRRFLQAFKEGRSEEDAIRETLFMTPEMLQQAWEFSLR